MIPFDRKVCCATVAGLAILMAGCSTPAPSQMSGTSSISSATGIGNLTGGAEAQPTVNPGVTRGSGSGGVGNLTGGAEARPTSDPGVTPAPRPKN